MAPIRRYSPRSRLELPTMYEARKTNRLRTHAFFQQYMKGRVIDIGAGDDLVCAWAEGFDLKQGDANIITAHREKAAYDAVHSSHCLEHMLDPRRALHEWWQLLKPGGHLILVVPDEDLYEQGCWPSRFNGDHKHTFTLLQKVSWSPVSHNIISLVSELPGARIVSAELQDQGYDHRLKSIPPVEPLRAARIYNVLEHACRHLPLPRRALQNWLEERRFQKYRIPIDQTLRDALAQIQIVAQKCE
jgi:SAM-dependent methyltransferase